MESLPPRLFDEDAAADYDDIVASIVLGGDPDLVQMFDLTAATIIDGATGHSWWSWQRGYIATMLRHVARRGLVKLVDEPVAQDAALLWTPLIENPVVATMLADGTNAVFLFQLINALAYRRSSTTDDRVGSALWDKLDPPTFYITTLVPFAMRRQLDACFTPIPALPKLRETILHWISTAANFSNKTGNGLHWASRDMANSIAFVRAVATVLNTPQPDVADGGYSVEEILWCMELTSLLVLSNICRISWRDDRAAAANRTWQYCMSSTTRLLRTTT